MYASLFAPDDLTMTLFRQVKLLNSISDNFHQAMKSNQGKLEFSQQFEAIVKGVEESLRKQLTVLTGKDQMVEHSKGIYQRVSHSKPRPPPTAMISHIPLPHSPQYAHQLVDEQRKYFKAVKDFQDECNKNDWLVSKLEQFSKSS